MRPQGTRAGARRRGMRARATRRLGTRQEDRSFRTPDNPPGRVQHAVPRPGPQGRRAAHAVPGPGTGRTRASGGTRWRAPSRRGGAGRWRSSVLRADSPSPLAVALDQVEGRVQRLRVLAGGGQCLGQLETEAGSSGLAAAAARAASSPPASPAWPRRISSALSFSASGSRNPRPPGSRSAPEPRRAGPREQHPGQARPGRGSPGRSPAPRDISPRPPRGRSPPAAAPRRRALGGGGHEPVDPGSGSPTRAGRRRTSRRPCRPGARRRPGSTGRRTPAAISGELLRVGLDQHELAAVLPRQPLQDRAERPAGPAPLGPEVDHHRDLARALDHVPLEVLRGGLDDVGGCVRS